MKLRFEIDDDKKGMGVSMFNPKAKSYPLVSGVDVAKSSDDKFLARYIFFIEYVLLYCFNYYLTCFVCLMQNKKVLLH